MAIFSVSDIIIAITLIINGLALMSTKISELLKRLSSDLKPKEARAGETKESSSLPSSSEEMDVENDNENDTESVYEKLAYVIQGLRRLSFIIVVWNVFFVFLMIGVFAS